MRELRIFYAAGPGDVIGTYAHWKAGRDDPSEMSATYSGQFFSICRDLGAQAQVVVQRAGNRRVDDGAVCIEECATPFQRSRNGLLFHLGQMIGAFHLAWHAVRFRAEVAIVLEGTHWFALTLLRLCGVRVVPDIHCTLWPMGHPPTRPFRRLLMRLNGWFWRTIPSATLCISPECERQISKIAGGQARNLIPTRPSYIRGLLDRTPPADCTLRPFVLVYAGRVEHDKGIFDLVELMSRLHRFKPGAFRCVICGSGGAVSELEKRLQELGLTEVVKLTGQLRQMDMRREVANAHALIVPTTSLFVEGLNRVAVEGVLAGRPVILTTVCPAWELISEAAITVEPGDIAAMCDAAQRLEGDAEFYESKRKACAALSGQFYDSSRSWGAGLTRAIRLALPERFSETEAGRVPV